MTPGRARPLGFSVICGRTWNSTLEEDGTQEWSSSLPAPSRLGEQLDSCAKAASESQKGTRREWKAYVSSRSQTPPRKTHWEKPVGSREKRREAAACIQTDRDALRCDDVKRWPGFRCEDRGGAHARHPVLGPPHADGHTRCPAPLPQHPQGWEHVLVSTSSLGKRSQSWC